MTTETLNTSGQDRPLAYDPNLHIVYVVEPQMNRIDAISVASHSIVRTIDVPQPTSVDVSADGTKLIIGTNTAYFFTADAVAGVLTGRFTFVLPVLNQPNTTQQIAPVGVTYLSDGTALIMSRNNPSNSSKLLLWDPVTNTVDGSAFSNLAVDSFGTTVSRSGDHTKALIVSSSNNKVGIYDANSKSITATKTYFNASLGRGILNSNGSRAFVNVTNFSGSFSPAISVLDGSLIEKLQVVGSSGGPFVVSTDSRTIYTSSSQCCGIAIIQRRDADPASPTGGQILPLSIPDAIGGTTLSDITETGLLVGLNGSGVVFIDPGKTSLFNASLTSFIPSLGSLTPRMAAADGKPVQTSSSTFSFNPPIVLNASLGNGAATSITPTTISGIASYSFTFPGRLQTGQVNFVYRLDSGWTSLVPFAFNFGTKIVRVRTSGGSALGGDNVSILGYGFGTSPTVTIGGAAATVQTGGVGFVPNGLEELTAISPPGSGVASVTVNGAFGTDTMPNAFVYAPDITTYVKTGPLNYLLYDPYRKLVYISNSAKIERFDVQNKQFLTAFQPTTVTSNTLFQGLALTSDGSKLLAADSGASLVHIIDPLTGNATSVSTAQFGSTQFGTNFTPQRVAGLADGSVLVLLPGGCQTCLLKLNLSDNSLTALFDPVFGNFFNSFDLIPTPDGSKVLLTDGLLYDGVNGFFISTSNSSFSRLGGPFSISSDGAAYFASSSNAVATLPDFAKTNGLTDSTQLLPTFSTTPGVMHPSGALVYKSFPNQFGQNGVNAIDIWDANTGRQRLRLAISDQFVFPGQTTPITTDDTGTYIFTITSTGLTVAHLDNAPLSIAHVAPAIVSNTGGETVKVLGSGFQPGATLQIGTTPVSAALVNGSLTFTNPGLANGSYPVTVTNPGGESYTLPLGFTSGPPNPAPTLSTISPTTMQVLDSSLQNQPLTLVINGSNFLATSTVMWNGNAVPSTLMSSTQLQATIPTSLLFRAGIVQVSVSNPLPGGGRSAFAQFTITAPAPTITVPSTPITLFANSTNQSFNITGTGFINQSTVVWDGTTTLQSSRGGSTIFVNVPASLLTTAGSHSVTVVNPGPGGGTSNALPINVIVPVPTLNVSPTLTTVSFGTIALGRANARFFSVFPGSPVAIQIGKLSIAGTGFTLVQDTCSNLVLQPSFGSCSFAVQFAPTISGNSTGTLTIPSNDPNSPKVLTLQGVGDNPPVIRLSVTPLGGSAPLTVNVSTTDSFDPDGVITSTRIDFGDGSTAQTATATHIYTHAGIFTLAAAVFDNQGIASVTSVLVDVENKIRSDFNGDGRADILWRNQSTGQNAVWFMNGTTLSSVQLITAMDTNWKIAGTGDFDGDGRADILWRNQSTGENVLWLMNGGSLVSQVNLPANADQNWQVAGVADFDGDTKMDILWRNRSTGENAIWFMNGGTITSGRFINAVDDQSWQLAVCADFDGDGKADILWRNRNTGDNVIWFMNGGTISSAQFTTAIADHNWQIAGAGDFNHDGIADILWRNRSTGQNAIWLMNGANIFMGQFIPDVTDQAWQVAVVADYSGDGAADILWRNQSTGANAIWLMSGTNFVSAQLIPAATNDWQPR